MAAIINNLALFFFFSSWFFWAVGCRCLISPRETAGKMQDILFWFICLMALAPTKKMHGYITKLIFTSPAKCSDLWSWGEWFNSNISLRTRNPQVCFHCRQQCSTRIALSCKYISSGTGSCFAAVAQSSACANLSWSSTNSCVLAVNAMTFIIKYLLFLRVSLQESPT